jgi:hypothetical protein
MKRAYELVHGSYRQEERTALELTVAGVYFLQFKKYLPTIIRNN